MELEEVLRSYFKERELNLEKRIISGAYTAFKGEECELFSIKKYKILNTSFNYTSKIDNSEYNLSVSNHGELRGDTEVLKGGEFFGLDSLITKESYKHGSKSRILSTILYSIFDDAGMRENYLPGEIMKLIEKMSNKRITFSRTNSDNCVYISRGTFYSTFYNVKKSINRMNNSSIKNDLKNLAKSIKENSNIMLQQKGLSAEERINVDYNSVQETYFNILMPSMRKLEKDNNLELINPLLNEEISYNRAKEIINDNSFYYSLFSKGIKDNFRKLLFKKSWQKKSSSDKAMICNDYDEFVEFDQFDDDFQNRGALGYIDNIGSSLASILNFSSDDISPNQAISGSLLAHISSASSTYEPISLKSLKNMTEEEITKNQNVYMTAFSEIMQKINESNM